MSAPDGGEYVTTIGPELSDGPLLTMSINADPVPPGTIVGVVVVTPRSEDAASVGTTADDALFPGVGSVVADAAVRVPTRVADGAALATTRNGTLMVICDPAANGPAAEQVMGPAGIGPAHPAGSAVMSTPVGGV
jgi:hypothetical protein